MPGQLRYGHASNLVHLLGRPGFRCIECDVTESVRVPGDVDLVMHLASAASPADYLKHPVQTLNAGGLGTLRCLGLAGEKNARFVLERSEERRVGKECRSRWSPY